jgi:monovalent cation:H+ antiporter-2, CPA2 family
VSAQPNFYRDLAYVFVAATGGGLIARWLRQPLILGYVLGGILIGPFTPGPTVSDVHVLELLAEVGVILLMYSIGIEFSLDDLRKVKWTAVIGGPLGILLSIGLGLGVGAALGWSTQQGIAIGATVSVASTMVLSRLLMDRGELQSPHGRLMIGITLIEDLAVVILTVLLPSAGVLSGERLAALALDIGKSLALLIPIMFVTAMVAPRLMAWVARMGSEELYLLIALALGLAVAAMT